VRKPEGKRPLGRPRRRWVDNIRMDLGEVGWGDVDWIGLAQDRNRWRALVNSVLNLRVPYNAGKLLRGLTTGGLSSSAQLHRVKLVNSSKCHLNNNVNSCRILMPIISVACSFSLRLHVRTTIDIR
jgi:hypothetical protein